MICTLIPSLIRPATPIGSIMNLESESSMVIRLDIVTLHRFPTRLQTCQSATTDFVDPAGRWQFVECEAHQEPDH
jgi:hypothetical protein